MDGVNYYNYIDQILRSSDSVLIIGIITLIVAITLSTPKIIKLMKQRQEFSSQRFEQEMERHRLLVDVIKENTRVNVELKAALESYKEMVITTLKNDREVFHNMLGQIREKIETQNAQTGEILGSLSNIKIILDRR